MLTRTQAHFKFMSGLLNPNSGVHYGMYFEQELPKPILGQEIAPDDSRAMEAKGDNTPKPEDKSAQATTSSFESDGEGEGDNKAETQKAEEAAPKELSDNVNPEKAVAKKNRYGDHSWFKRGADYARAAYLASLPPAITNPNTHRGVNHYAKIKGPVNAVTPIKAWFAARDGNQTHTNNQPATKLLAGLFNNPHGTLAPLRNVEFKVPAPNLLSTKQESRLQAVNDMASPAAAKGPSTSKAMTAIKGPANAVAAVAAWYAAREAQYDGVPVPPAYRTLTNLGSMAFGENKPK